MSRRRPAPPQRDLFGAGPPGLRDTTSIGVPMVEVSPGTDKAWHLKPAGVSSARAAFAPRSEVRRDPERTDVFHMPRWIAAERGWL